jgi:hypothetical protein
MAGEVGANMKAAQKYGNKCGAVVGLELQRLKPSGFASLMPWLKPGSTKITTRTKDNVLDGQKKEGVVNNQRQDL